MDLEKRHGYEPTNRQRVRLFRVLFLILAAVLASQQPISQPQLALAKPLSATGAFIEVGDDWRYLKGTSEASTPIDAWRQQGFDDSGWLVGPSGFGYGDGDDATLLDDMQGSYVSLFIRKTFTVTDPSALTQLTLEIDYDDGFVAYLNGTEVARREMGNPGDPVYYNSLADSHHEAGTAETIDLSSSYLGLLQAGTNVLAIQGHNVNLSSSDFSLIPALRWDDIPLNLLVYPYLGETTTTSVIISWATNSPGASEVRYSPDQSYSNVVAAINSTYDGKYWHSATVTGLTADTTYYYKVYTSDEDVTPWSVITFTTAPEDTVPQFTFVALGDSRPNGPTSPPSQGALDVAAEMDQHSFDLALHTGDIPYSGGICSGDGSSWNQYIRAYFDLYQESMGDTPFYPSVGNHELSGGSCGYQGYTDVYYLPGNAPSGHEEEYYSFDWGNAHFVALDTNQDHGVGSTQHNWLVNDLQTSTQSWKFVFFHHPPYSSGPHGSSIGVRARLVPVFETYGVDVVFNGHDHDYERTCPILNGACTTPQNGGVVYYVTGGAGAPLYSASSDWFTAYSDSLYHFLKVEVADCTLTLEAIDTAGTVFDSFVIDRCQYTPVLDIVKEGPSTANVGDTSVFTFTVTNDNVHGNGSPISNVSVSDDLAGTATFVNGDDGDDLLQVGETWVYTAGYTIQATDPNPLVNTATVTGQDEEGEDIPDATDGHSTAIEYTPALAIVKEGPSTANVGDTVVFTFTVTNDNVHGDGSPISNIAVSDDLAGTATLVSGDDLLQVGETWVYTAGYTIQATDPNPLVNTATVTGQDAEGEDVPDATDGHSTEISAEPTHLIFLPIVLK
jgi:hypothetical protein